MIREKKVSLKYQHSNLADSNVQIDILEHGEGGDFALVPFQQKLEETGLYPLRPTSMEIFQVNVGKMCNQVCKHCHVDAGPDRKEIMTRETMQQCLDALANNPGLKIVDLTGGAPEMNPDFRWFVEGITAIGRHVIVRCNLTIIRANKKYYDLPEFFKKHRCRSGFLPAILHCRPNRPSAWRWSIRRQHSCFANVE